MIFFLYTKKVVIIISFVITIIVYSFLILIFNQYDFYSNKKSSQVKILISSNEIVLSDNNHEEIINSIEVENIDSCQEVWQIYIPKINLKANIKEGTSQLIMKINVGHFENTPIWNGNVGLAAHNRGDSNFFENIHTLKQGDIIFYETKEGKRKYEVFLNQRIDETDWSYLENTNDNIITLITCVKDMPEYRTCIQAKEIIDKL